MQEAQRLVDILAALMDRDPLAPPEDLAVVAAPEAVAVGVDLIAAGRDLESSSGSPEVVHREIIRFVAEDVTALVRFEDEGFSARVEWTDEGGTQ